jgi:Ion channel
MAENLAMATVMVTLTVIIHFVGLLALLRLLDRTGHHFRPLDSTLGQGVLIILVVLGLFAIHTVEIWAYALCFIVLGAINDFESALYFSTVTFTTVGYGDIVLDPGWRLLGAIEAANGFILFGWSTAFLLSLTRSLRALEHDWLARRGHARQSGEE